MNIRTLLFLLPLLLPLHSFADAENDANKLFVYAERNFPDLLSPAWPDTQEVEGYIYRFYSNTGIYLAVKDGQVYALGGPVGNDVVAVGPLDNFIDVTKSAGCTAPSTKPKRGAPAAPYEYVFKEGPAVETSNHAISISFAYDINRDGKLDVISVSQDGADESTYSLTSVYINQGNAVFVREDSSKYFGESSTFYGPRDYALLDANEDGLVDLYAAQPGFDDGRCGQPGVNCSGASNVLLLAKSGGGFENVSSTALVPNPGDGFTHSGDAADIDCDGDVDLFEAQWGNPQAQAPASLKLNSLGTFTEATTGRIDSKLIEQLAGSGFCDLDRDGDADLLIGPSAEGSSLRIAENDGQGVFTALPDDTVPGRPGFTGNHIPSDIACGDLDGDGFLDIVYHDHTFGGDMGKFMVTHNLGRMRFENWNSILPEPEKIRGFTAGGGPAMIRDLNDDGWPDLIDGGARSGVEILWNTGGAFKAELLTYVQPTPPQGFNGYQGVSEVSGDFNGDGKTDLWLKSGFWIHILLAK